LCATRYRPVPRAKASSSQLDRRMIPVFVGVRHWLTFSFSVRAQALRFRPASRPSGSCSGACRPWPFPCDAPRAARCTNGSPMTRGSARHVNRAIRACCGRRAPPCSASRPSWPQRRRNAIKAVESPADHRNGRHIDPVIVIVLIIVLRPLGGASHRHRPHAASDPPKKCPGWETK
jgi:hypothetical protein